jgi:diguanylate cyclase (GGDEF)-like protein
MPGIDVDHLPCGLVELDRAGRLVKANARFCEWVGTDDPLGRHLSDFIDSADPTAGLTSRDIVFLRTEAGAPRPVLVEQAADGGVITFFDATHRQEVEDGLHRSHALVRRTQNRLQLVIDASIAFAAAQTEPELASLLAETAARAYAAEEAIVFLSDDDGRLHPAAGSYPLVDLAHSELVGLPELRRGEVVKVSGADEAFELAAPVGRSFESAGVYSMIVAPVLHEGELLAAFACFFLHPRQFDEQASPLAGALAGQAGQVITTLRLQRRLEHAATHDGITGLPNRRYLEERLRTPEERVAGSVAILFVDLDGFKLINDSFGHSVGDRLLAEVGQRLREVVRESDVVARYGGDEFVVVADVDDAESASALAERVRTSLEQEYDVTGDALHVTASIGLAMADWTVPIETDQLIRLADQAMYDAKSTGGNRIALATA